MIPPPSSISSPNDTLAVIDTIGMGVGGARGRMNPETVKKSNSDASWSVQNRQTTNQS